MTRKQTQNSTIPHENEIRGVIINKSEPNSLVYFFQYLSCQLIYIKHFGVTQSRRIKSLHLLNLFSYIIHKREQCH